MTANSAVRLAQAILVGILTRKLSEKIKPFEPTMSNLANGKVNLKFNNYALMQSSSSLCSNFILNLYIFFELNNNWPVNTTNNFTLKNCLFGTIK